MPPSDVVQPDLPWFIRFWPWVPKSWFLHYFAESQRLHALLSVERREKERLTLALIEAQKPGIDIERVRAERG